MMSAQPRIDDPLLGALMVTQVVYEAQVTNAVIVTQHERLYDRHDVALMVI